MKFLRSALLALLACLSLPALSANLTLVNGELLGATDVLVNGELYDVSFLDGSCIEPVTGSPRDLT